jgi:hypothetical protein
MKNSEIYLMAKSTPTLTQSGLLAVLLQSQRHTAIELAERRARRNQSPIAFSSALLGCWRVFAAPWLVHRSTEALDGHP